MKLLPWATFWTHPGCTDQDKIHIQASYAIHFRTNKNKRNSPIRSTNVRTNPILLTGLKFNCTVMDFLCPWHWFLIDFNVIGNYTQKLILYVRKLIACKLGISAPKVWFGWALLECVNLSHRVVRYKCRFHGNLPRNNTLNRIEPSVSAQSNEPQYLQESNTGGPFTLTKSENESWTLGFLPTCSFWREFFA